ncbi:efflux transporter outer membrane subunit [Estrella lausannensis]|uniref:Outer membrane efflux family protein n=1 Tax=Estrella lausannensis TaxID=483423 RepID=A0A0H5DS61_9BACT|nr:efflux transporter outer membrane subunit [Estrella lausannensis]CRX39566.1 outer membrane efflux family protein [Estrella lausannensis]
MNTKRLCALIASLPTLFCLTTSCGKVGPDWKSPGVTSYHEWTEDNARVTSGEEDLSHWWTQFDDPTLTYLIETARLSNATLTAKAWRIEEARAALGIAVGEFFPQQQRAFGSHYDIQLSKNGPNTQLADLKFKDALLGFQSSWELDFWGKFRRGIESAEADYSASIEDYRDFLVILTADVASAYFRLKTIEERLLILDDNIRIQARGLEIASARFEAGYVTDLDVQQAKALLKETEARKPLLLLEKVNAENSLAVLTGKSPETMRNLSCNFNPLPPPPLQMAAGVPADLLCRRPDIRRATLIARSSLARIGIAESELYPSLSISGSIGLESAFSTQSTKADRKFFSSDSLFFSYGPSFSWPILNYGRLENQVIRQKAIYYSLLSELENSVLSAYAEAENALAAFVYFHDQVTVLEEMAKAARRATSLANTQYVEGMADYTRVLTASEKALEAEERLAESKGNIFQSVVSTYKSLGGGW